MSYTQQSITDLLILTNIVQLKNEIVKDGRIYQKIST